EHPTVEERPNLSGDRMKKRITALTITALLALPFEFGLAQQAPYYLPAEIPMNVETLYRQLEPAPSYRNMTRDILRQLERYHYSDIELNDAFSSDLLDSYINGLDMSRVHFTAADIAEFEQYRDRLDDMLEAGDTS